MTPTRRLWSSTDPTSPKDPGLLIHRPKMGCQACCNLPQPLPTLLLLQHRLFQQAVPQHSVLQFQTVEGVLQGARHGSGELD